MWFQRRGDQAEEAALVRAAIQGDAAAFQKLVNAYFGLVYTIAFSRLKERETAEDMAQEARDEAAAHQAEREDPM